MKPRTLVKTILTAIESFPAVVVTGPRQSGKTTLLKTLFSKTHRFVSLEDLDVRMRAKEDPLSFLEENKPPVVIDEIQYLPDLLSYIKSKIDERRKPGQWIFTGSQNFVLMQGVSQSLAGRAAILSLLPFSLTERIGQGATSKEPGHWIKDMIHPPGGDREVSLSEILLRGFYPEIASRTRVNRQLWCGSYISTYLERDVRNLVQVGDLSQFERFLKLCAVRTGQLLNLSELARDIGISVPTAKRWLSILETGYQIYLLYPYYKNVGKRLVKSPKLYFMDSGLATYLLGIHDRNALVNSPNFGSLFETFVITDILKRFLHSGQMPSMYSLRTRDGLEVDLAIEWAQRLHFFEIKSAMTILPKHAASLLRIRSDVKSSAQSAFVISQATKNFGLMGGVYNLNWKRSLAL